jgi:hypothetical protein
LSDTPPLLPEDGFGSRAFAPIPQQQPADMESVRIQSMDVLAEVIEAATDVVGDVGSITLADIEKLIKRSALTKKDITDAIRDALIQPVLPVRDSSVLVRSQVKAGDIQEASRKKVVSTVDDGDDGLNWSESGEDKKRGSFKTGGSRGPFQPVYEGYQKLMGLMETATQRPLRLIDMSVAFLAKSADKVLGLGAGLLGLGLGKVFGRNGRRGEKEDFFGPAVGGSSDKPGEGYQNDSDSPTFGRRAPVQTASISSGGFDSIFNAVPGFVSDDYQTARVQGASQFSFFGGDPDLFSGGVGARGSPGGPAQSADLRSMQSFGQFFTPAGVSDISVNVPPVTFPSIPDVVVNPFMPGAVPVPMLGPSEASPVSGLSPVFGTGEASPVSGLVPMLGPSEASPASGLVPVPMLGPSEASPVSGLSPMFGTGEASPVSGPVPMLNNLLPSPAPSFGQDAASLVPSGGPLAPLISGSKEDSGVGAGSLLPGFPGFPGFGGGESGKVSTEDNLASEVMESDLRANKMLFRTFDEPEKSDFGKFLDNQITGGTGGKGESKAKGLLSAIFEGFLLAGLLFALPFIVDKVIPFIKDDLVPFIKGPFLDFVKAAGGFLGTMWEHMGPVVISVIKAVGGWLKANGEDIWKAIGQAAGAIGGWLTTSVWPAVEKAAKAVGGWLTTSAWPAIERAAGAIGKWLKAEVWPEVEKAAVAIGEWVDKTAWPAFSEAMSNFGEFITETLWPFLKEVGGPAFVSSLVNSFGAVGDLFNTLSGKMSLLDYGESLVTRVSNRVRLGATTAGAAVAAVFGEEGDFLSERAKIDAQGTAIITRHNAGSELGSRFYLDYETGEMYRVRKGVDREPFIGAINDYMWPLQSWGSVKDASVLSKYADVVGTVGALGSGSSVKDAGVEGTVEGVKSGTSVEDAIITSEGQVIHTDPEDNIYAFKGDVSIAPANRTREFSGSPVAYNSQQSSVVNNNNVTNNYNVLQSIFNGQGLLPGSEFDPVGV